MAHIWLIGMMGSGKTTVGALVAERLGMPLVDTDAMVMETSGRTIPELFEESEEAFRAAERSAIAAAASGPSAVVSTGGGAVLDPANASLMASTGQVILLTASPAVLADRIGSADARPLYHDAEQLSTLLEKRWVRYAEAADHVIDTENMPQDDVAEEVVRCVSM